MSKANNSPTNWSEGLTIADKSNMLGVFETFRQMPAVRKENIKDIEERLEMYFKQCADYGIVPTVESMCVALGVSRQALWKWQQNNCEAGELIERAKQVINCMLTTATIQGKVNFAYTIWLQKNHFNYTDAQRLEVANVTDVKTLTSADLPKLNFHSALPSEELPQLSVQNAEEN